MRHSVLLALLASFSATLAAPASSSRELAIASLVTRGRREGAAPPAGRAEEGEKKEGEEEEEDPNEIEQAGQFGVPITVNAGNKTDTLFPPGQNGVFEIELQTGAAKTLTVTQNPTPGTPPAGFVALEAASFIVSVAEGAEGATLQKVDYILNTGSTLDISQGKVGRFDAATGAFSIDPSVGEQEFEKEENELVLKVTDLNGEFAVFIPEAAAAPGAGAGQPLAGQPGAGAVQQLLLTLASILGSGSATAPAGAPIVVITQ